MNAYTERLARYEAFIERCPRIEKKGKNMHYTSANGHMFSQLNKDGELGIRFSKEVQERYFLELHTTYFKSYGAVMKGYVLIPDALWEDTDRIVELLNESYDYVLSLDPK